MSFVNYLFFFNDPATTEIYTLSLHDALPISGQRDQLRRRLRHLAAEALQDRGAAAADGGRLLVEEPGRADQLLQLRAGQPEVLLRPPAAGEERRRHLVHPLVRALRREDRGDQQLERG